MHIVFSASYKLGLGTIELLIIEHDENSVQAIQFLMEVQRVLVLLWPMGLLITLFRRGVYRALSGRVLQ